MIPTIQFDLGTLTIWTTCGTLSGELAELAKEVMAATARGDDPVPAIIAGTNDDFIRQRMLFLASCVWHEKRHFFDTCITNYGARQFRDLFILGANAYFLVAEAKKRNEPVWFPVEIYESPILRKLFGISEPHENIIELARRARVKKRFANILDAPIESPEGKIDLGGRAQLEGLAQASQMNSIEHRFGVSNLAAISLEYAQQHSIAGPYRSIEVVAGALGCSKTTTDGHVLVNTSLASALFVTALSGRFIGNGPTVEAGFVSPSVRITRLMEELGSRPGHFDMSEEEAWDRVDKAARRIWGRTCLEEIEVDVDKMDEATASFSTSPFSDVGLNEVWADFISLRRRLLSEVKAHGAESLSPHFFPIHWLDRLCPWHIEATPGGDVGNNGGAVVFGRKFEPPAGWERVVPPSVTWGRLHEPEGRGANAISVKNREGWLQMLERIGPLALLMLNGRRHRLMVPPALERPIEEIINEGVSVRFDPDFEWPTLRDDATRSSEALELAKWAGRASFICDLTSVEIAPSDAALLTPWEFRRSALLPMFYKNYGEMKFIADLKLIIDWSDWVVRSDLLSSESSPASSGDTH